MGFYEKKSLDELRKELRGLDYGFSNPRKASMAREDENDIEQELKRRGFNDEAIRRFKQDDD